MVNEIKQSLEYLDVPEKAALFSRFFKAGKGEYAEGDRFIGVSVPHQRQIAKEFWDKISLKELGNLLSSKIHEHRHTALLMLVLKFEKSKCQKQKQDIVDFYLENLPFINNWDLVDSTCYKILGRYCFENQRDDILRKLADEDNLWSNRIAIVATMWHAKKGRNFKLLKELALKNIQHPHDLMHKANGWLLKEMGKQSEPELLAFLAAHYSKIPRTTLRYAIEKFPAPVRNEVLKGKFDEC